MWLEYDANINKSIVTNNTYLVLHRKLKNY